MNLEPQKKLNTEHPKAKSRPGDSALNVLTTIIYYLAILFFIIGFNFSHNPAGNWYQQFLPNLNGRTISDITFIDSLTGWAVTPYLAVNDTSFVLKTSNGGDDWFIQHTRTGQFVGSNRVYFINANTGFTAGVSNLPAYSAILKTTDGGNTWSNVNPPTDPFTARDISILNSDTIWVVSDNSLTGGVFRTTNGGSSWENQLSAGSGNPDRIYLFNSRIGFACNGSSSYKTTNSGINWLSFPGNNFTDMHFIDSLNGWRCNNLQMSKTTNGGASWIVQQLPVGGLISEFGGMLEFSHVNKDTIWGTGGYLFYGAGRNRGIIYKTVNGGTNWWFQLPDTSYGIPRFRYSDFTNRLNGWAYNSYSLSGNLVSSGVHTVSGGDTIDYTPIYQASEEVPQNYRLFNNYPNPFNPTTNIKYQISESKFVNIVIFDVTGKKIIDLVNKRHSSGTYIVEFDAGSYSSGIYFYSLSIDGKIMETKAMVLIK